MASPDDLESGGGLPVPPAPGATIGDAIEKDDKKPVKGGAKKDQLADVKTVVLGAMATKDADNAILLQRIQQLFERYYLISTNRTPGHAAGHAQRVRATLHRSTGVRMACANPPRHGAEKLNPRHGAVHYIRVALPARQCGRAHGDDGGPVPGPEHRGHGGRWRAVAAVADQRSHQYAPGADFGLVLVR